MESTIKMLPNTSTSSSDSVANLIAMDLSKVFSQRNGSYLNELELFIAHFNKIPNLISERFINCKKANLWFKQNYGNEIKNCCYNKRYFEHSKQAELDDVFYFLYEDLIVDFDTNCSIVRFLFKDTPVSKVQEIIGHLRKFRKSKNKAEISLLVETKSGIDTKELKISKPKLNIADNYNDDFKEIHQTIVKRLSKKDDKGLILLHGKPGTGKTSYIRYLISTIKKNVIFLPPIWQAQSLTQI